LTNLCNATKFASFLQKELEMADISRLPKPLPEVWQWQSDGACRGEDTEMFFHPEGERGPARANRIARAKAVCATCPVIQQCAAHALSVREPYGIWGGMSEDDREEIYTRRETKPQIA
jgi:WhiB family redox-sensing transcriptional regulator